MEELEQQLFGLIDQRGGDARKVRQACDFARERLSGVVRETGEPAYTHALRVALIVAEEISLSNVSIVAALLHETLTADNDVSRRIERDFGPQVLFIINEMLKISHLQKEKLKLNSENYISLVLTITKDVRVVLLKLADTLDKIRQIKLYGAERQLKIAQTARALYAPIAHRLGLYHIKTELEDISLKIIEPEMYYGIARKLNETKDRREQYISRFKQSVGDTLNSALAGHGYSYEIKGRPKSVNSIYGKIKKQGVDISEIYDLFAIRIILDNVPAEKEKEACWNVYSIITNIYQPNPTRLRDWISTPRASGYESLHTTVMGPDGHWVEVQIRTRRMDDVAEKGNAAHWKYKESGKDESHDQWLSNIRGILESKDGSFDSELDGSGLQLKTANIFAFTPQGDIIKLRQGATILDFAYSIHSNLGNTCTGARVNGKIVPIKYQLSNGDTVEVLTSKNQRPNLEWLNIAVSPRIKARIRRAINEETFKHAEMGREMLERKVAQLKLDFNDQIILQMTAHFHFSHALDFYQAIADDKVDLHAVRDFLLTLKAEPDSHPTETPDSNGEYTATFDDSDDALIIGRDLVNVDYKLAQCCHPIQGDRIFGFVTVDRGIQIHRQGCPNAKDLLARYPYRIIKARWNDTERQSVFNADIIVTGIDKLGVVNHITEVIAKSETSSLRSLKVNSKDGIFKAYISVFVGSTAQLDALLLSIGKIKDVIRAERAER